MIMICQSGESKTPGENGLIILLISPSRVDFVLDGSKWQPKSEIVKLKKTIKAKIFAAREWEGEMMDEEEQESADRGEIDA